MFASLKSLKDAAAAVVASAIALGLSPATSSAAVTMRIAGPAVAAPAYHFQEMRGAQPDALTFFTLDNPADPTFNQLLGINNNGTISGYFGSGSAGHPNKGYTIAAPYTTFVNENYPGSFQTQVVALNNHKDTAGFWVDGKGSNFGFIEWNGVFTTYRDPMTGKGTVNQILGINDSGIAVGFYTDGNGVNHGFEVNQATSVFTPVAAKRGTNVTASGINKDGDVTGFLTAGNGQVVGFLIKNGTFSEFLFPNAVSTTPFGINANDEIVGSYTDTNNLTHGFTLTNPLTNAHFAKIDDPNGIGTTIVNGVNDLGALVGFYVDGAGNTDGFIAKK
jgi:hypothetical protein